MFIIKLYQSTSEGQKRYIECANSYEVVTGKDGVIHLTIVREDGNVDESTPISNNNPLHWDACYIETLEGRTVDSIIPSVL